MSSISIRRVVFHSTVDLAGGMHLSEAERILRSPPEPSYTDINDILELYNIKMYFDNGVFLESWDATELSVFQAKVATYGSAIGQFMSGIDDATMQSHFGNVLQSYVPSFWRLFNDHSVHKRVSADVFKQLLDSAPYLLRTVLVHKNIVKNYDSVLRDSLLNYSHAAELLLSVYEIDSLTSEKKYLPKSLTQADKESIFFNYLQDPDANLKHIELIQYMKTRSDFRVTDKLRLQAQRSYSTRLDFLQKNGGLTGQNYGVSVSFKENIEDIKSGNFENNYLNYVYSLDYINSKPDCYSLFLNFKYLFEYVDDQNRIQLVSKPKDLNMFEVLSSVTSKNSYVRGFSFSISELSSQAQIHGYSRCISKLNTSLEDIINFVFEKSFQELYGFADNAVFPVPTAKTHLEKIRVLAPYFESALKQFKLFVEDKAIDFDLLEISSAPSAIKDIPSLNNNKYIYLNKDVQGIGYTLRLLFSDQTTLTYVDPFKDDNYATFFELIRKEEVKYSEYERHQKLDLDYLIDHGFITISNDDVIMLNSPERVLILKDLYDNEVGSFYHYSPIFQQEAKKMASEDIIVFESSLFSRSEQSYLNYYLNKSEFIDGRDLRNSYLHGTQPNPMKTQEHERAYFIYLQLIFLALLKIDDDLYIYNAINNSSTI